MALAALALAGALARTARAADPPRVAGWLTLDAERASRWGWSGAWAFPVGDPLDHTRGVDGAPGFQSLRGLIRGRRPHDGADLGCGRAGDPVRAAASGLVARVERGESAGYGVCVVLAHRLADGGLAYSVYAHLQRDGVAVTEGESVALGQRLGRVGRTGRASTDHLHFEVRRPHDLGERWERAPVVEPLAFVSARLPAAPEGETAEVVRWGAGGDLVGDTHDAAAPLTRAAWWHMLWRSARHDGDVLPDGLGSLGEALAAARVLEPAGGRARPGAVGWEELARDLERLRERGVRLPAPAPIEPEALRALCESVLGTEHPGRALAQRPPRGEGPTVAQALVALAALALEAGR